MYSLEIMSLSRLQKIISDSGLLSRRKVDLLIKQVRVTFNGLQEWKWWELKTKKLISIIN